MTDTMKPTLPLEEWFSHETVQRLIDEAYAAGLEDARSFRRVQKEHELEAMERYIAKITLDKGSAHAFLSRAGIIDQNGELAEQFRQAKDTK
jgi:hypothetical protein